MLLLLEAGWRNVLLELLDGGEQVVGHRDEGVGEQRACEGIGGKERYGQGVVCV